MRKVDVLVKGPGSGPRDRHPLAPEHRHRGHRHQGRDPGAPQRLPPAQAAEGLRGHGSLHRTQGPASRAVSASTSSGTTRARPSPSTSARTRPASTAAAVAAAAVGVPAPAAGEAEGQLHLRRLWSGSSATSTRRPAARRASPARTCSAARACASTTSSSAPAGRATRPQARQFVSHGHVNVNGSGSTSRATASARATSSRCATRPAR